MTIKNSTRTKFQSAISRLREQRAAYLGAARGEGARDGAAFILEDADYETVEALSHLDTISEELCDCELHDEMWSVIGENGPSGYQGDAIERGVHPFSYSRGFLEGAMKQWRQLELMVIEGSM